MYIYIYIDIYRYIYIYTHIYTYAYIDVHMHTQKFTITDGKVAELTKIQFSVSKQSI